MAATPDAVDVIADEKVKRGQAVQTTSANTVAACEKYVPAAQEVAAGVQPVDVAVPKVDGVDPGEYEPLAHTVHTRFATVVAGAE